MTSRFFQKSLANLAMGSITTLFDALVFASVTTEIYPVHGAVPLRFRPQRHEPGSFYPASNRLCNCGQRHAIATPRTTPATGWSSSPRPVNRLQATSGPRRVMRGGSKAMRLAPKKRRQTRTCNNRESYRFHQRNKVLNTIQYPVKDSEFEVQASLWSRLRSMGLDVKGCVRSQCEDGGRHPNCFFDLVVFDDLQVAKVIIECKNQHPDRVTELRGRQLRRYSKFKLPIVGCYFIADIPRAIEQILNVL